MLLSAIAKAMEKLPTICEKLGLDKRYINEASVFEADYDEKGGCGPNYGREKYLRINIGEIHLYCEYELIFNLFGELTSIRKMNWDHEGEIYYTPVDLSCIIS
jgi:hypothetical protein